MEQIYFKLRDFTDEELKNNSGIYQIRNIQNNHFYIGSAKNLYRRRSDHFNDLKRNKHHCKHLQNSFNLYNENNFVFEIIQLCTTDILRDIEQLYLDKNFGQEYFYNISKVANGGPNKYSKGHKSWNKGKKCLQLAGVNNGFYGKKHSEEFIKFIKDKNKGQPIYILDMDFNIKKRYECVSYAKEYGYIRSNLEKTVKGKGSLLRKLHYYNYGEIAFYVDDFEKITNEDKKYYKNNINYYMNKDRVVETFTSKVFKNKLQASKILKTSSSYIDFCLKRKDKFIYFLDWLKEKNVDFFNIDYNYINYNL